MNYKVVVDAGHGGTDPGAVYGGLQEKDLTLQAALYMYDRLNELGIPAKLTRDSDETLPKSERIKRILNAFGNRDDVIVVSNHINAGGGDGAEVVYALRNKETLAKNILNNIAKEGQNIRRYYQRRLPSDQSKDYYFIHRETGKTEPVLVEYGFIDSPKDDIGQLKNNLNDYVEAVVKSIADYTGVSYTAPGQKADTYIVKKGDSLYSIASKYGVSVEELKKVNNLSGNVINVGQLINIPKKDSSNSMIYTVKNGDSLWKIAQDFGVSVNDLISYNNLGTTFLQVGQQLLIPEKQEMQNDSITYIVKKGDTLWSIAKKYNISVDELKKNNNITNNMISIGQKLIIPNSNSYKTYVVKSGDSLWKIAQDFGVDFQDIIKINNLNSNVLSIGQTLLIP